MVFVGLGDNSAPHGEAMQSAFAALRFDVYAPLMSRAAGGRPVASVYEGAPGGGQT